MTIIAWDGQSLAADKRAGTHMPWTITKIRRTNSGSLIGCSGSACSDAEFMRWFESGAKVEDFPVSQKLESTSSCMLEITPEGQIRMYIGSHVPAVIEDKRYAIGSGSDFAMAAMYLGKTAREAVEVTIALTATCGNGIDTLDLRKDCSA